MIFCKESSEVFNRKTSFFQWSRRCSDNAERFACLIADLAEQKRRQKRSSSNCNIYLRKPCICKKLNSCFYLEISGIENKTFVRL